eukprot:TRINITY_DN24189_c0_g1_i1.p1 TRINITY_DN24189_c0_g1~~TRINITY_DN24189_c0_g1_i1.p1  ORF type:complete len:411 (+),score=125.85 TRINITY_DN24189_c0_g1_i1:76-1233(+)
MPLARTRTVLAAAGNRAFMIAATGQHVGKTTTCLGLVAGAVQRHGPAKVSYMKPVGQQWVEVDTPDGKLRVDKDAVLFKEFFRLQCPYTDMSSILIPKGYTRDYIDGKTDGEAENHARLQADFRRLQESTEVTVIEGTGHAGVGSVIELNNARVAQLLGVPAVLIGSGGIGNAIDQLTLSKTLFEAFNVPIKGIIINKVLAEKSDMVENYMRKVVEGRWGVPLLGVVPVSTMLEQPTVNDLAIMFRKKFIAGEKNRLRRIADVQLIATSLEAFTEQTMYSRPNQLFVVPSGRTDIILAMIADLKTGGFATQSSLIMTGEYPPQQQVLQSLQSEQIPALHVSEKTAFEVCSMIATFTPKIRFEDREKLQKAVDMMGSNIDFDRLLS